MKKILTLGFIALLMLSICACNSGNPTLPATTQPITTAAPTAAPTTPATVPATAATQPPVVTTAPHTHDYTQICTKNPTCLEEGEWTHLCACGDIYTTATERSDHNWSVWYESTPATLNQPSELMRQCTVCHVSETMTGEMSPLRQSIESYMSMIPELPNFDDAGQLSGGMFFNWLLCQVEPISAEWNEDTFLITRVYAIADFDAFTTKYLGYTYDYLYLVEFDDALFYDEATHTITHIIGGMGGGYGYHVDEVTDLGNGQYLVRYYALDWETESPAYYGQLTLVQVDDFFMILAHHGE